MHALRAASRRAAAATTAAASRRRYVASAPRAMQQQHDHQAVAYADAGSGDFAPHQQQQQQQQQQQRVFADWSVYKSKAAMTVRAIKPSWESLPPREGVSGGAYSVGRQGRLLLEFAAAATSGGGGGGDGGGGGGGGGGGARQAPAGQRSYRWSDKVTIALNVNELGELFANPAKPHSFFHDPQMGVPGAQGAVTKQLTVNPGQGDDDGVYFNATSTQAGGQRTTVAVRLSQGEFYVLKAIGTQAIPQLLGFDLVFSSA